MAGEKGVPPVYSPDGHWYWNGSQWIATSPPSGPPQPYRQAPSPLPPAPQMAAAQMGPMPAKKGMSTAMGCLIAFVITFVLILAVLAAVVIPVVVNQSAKGKDSAVEADLRNAATAQETVFTQTGQYTGNVSDLQQAGFIYSEGSNYQGGTANIDIVLTGAGTFCIDAVAATGTSFRYESVSGLAQGSCP